MATTSSSKAKPKTEIVNEPEDKPDEKLVDETVAFIAKTMQETVDKGLGAIGDHILKHFFGDDAAKVMSTDPKKNASFRLLAERCGQQDLPVSKSWLHNAVGIAIMRRQLPAEATAFRQLPASLQATLLPLRVPATVEEVALRAVTKKMSLRQLRDTVSRERAKRKKPGDGRGRPHTPVVRKFVDRAFKALVLEDGKRVFTAAQVKEVEEGRVAETLKSAQILVRALQDLVEKLGAKA